MLLPKRHVPESVLPKRQPLAAPLSLLVRNFGVCEPPGTPPPAYMQGNGGIYYWVRDYAFKDLMPRVQFPSFGNQLLDHFKGQS